jgi:hypothetical protein
MVPVHRCNINLHKYLHHHSFDHPVEVARRHRDRPPLFSLFTGQIARLPTHACRQLLCRDCKIQNLDHRWARLLRDQWPALARRNLLSRRGFATSNSACCCFVMHPAVNMKRGNAQLPLTALV